MRHIVAVRLDGRYPFDVNIGKRRFRLSEKEAAELIRQLTMAQQDDPHPDPDEH